jgi:hypothetical protein
MSTKKMTRAEIASSGGYGRWKGVSPKQRSAHATKASRAAKEARERRAAAYKAMQEALKPFSEFMNAFDRKPISHLDPDELYAIHGGYGRPTCPDGASIRWDDLRQARAALRQSEL